jgi:O-antigen/teichoic acid export membrane protein
MELTKKLSFLLQHRFVKSVAFLQVASTLGTFTQALIGIFIARILQPELYGVYAVAFGLAALVFISTGVQETITIVLSEAYVKKDREATHRALVFFLRFTVLFSLITLAITLLLPWISTIIYHDSRVGLYAAIVIVASVISSFAFSMSSMVLQVIGDIKKMGVLILADQALRFMLSLALVAAGFGILGAALGHLIGAIIIFVASALVWRKTNKTHAIFPSLRDLVTGMKNPQRSGHLSFSIWATIDKNIAMLYGILPVLLVGIYLSRSEVSYFKLAFGFVTLALSFLGPISTLLNSEFSRMKLGDPQQMRKNFIRVTLFAVGISTVLTVVAIIAAPFVFHILYGASYLQSIQYIPGLLVYGALFGIGVALGPMWRVINKVKTSILINGIVLGIGIPMGLYWVKHFGVWGAIVMVTAWFTISHVVSFFYLLGQLGGFAKSNMVR